MKLTSNTVVFLKSQIDEGETVSIVQFAKFSKIQDRFVFEKYFKSVIDQIIVSFKENDGLYSWAKEIKEYDYEVLDRTSLSRYWVKVEKEKFQINLEYAAVIKLNKTTKMEAQLYRC